MGYLEVLILAAVQAAAELLPVSSSAHVVVAEKWMGIDPSSPRATFLLVMLHTGTMFAVLLYFWPRWRALMFGPSPAHPPHGETPSSPAPSSPGSPWHFPTMVAIATAVTLVVGVGLILGIEKGLAKLTGRDASEVEELFKNLPLMGLALFAVGLVIIEAGVRDKGTNSAPLDGRAAAIIGAVQGLCLPLRGFSRSGATISTSLFLGIPRALAEDFSFALAVVITPPAILRQLLRVLKKTDYKLTPELTDMVVPGLVGMVLAFLFGLLALRFLSSLLEQGRWKYFGYYCLAFAAVVWIQAYRGGELAGWFHS
jgi:undecaprenyl-diphosphatase